ncbi:sigma-70 family RNA polymerase sigma factor [Clostridium botulinum]|uniref:sigma-70 family RNA polymerase sigma factor n=1 Tax=Clostridium botulinum TaxID=1491 RepID=UPI000D128483|nr:sigma-70 family RNA polymerase sigma factor [Clostridium botulinum]AVQ45782.1 RNA polymerase subunit sigma [Clostridium botulinum]AVQ48420.1 RNA polymerase subunit sigma [Clostridium botulinum]
MEQIDLIELAKLAKKGDKVAFSKLIKTYEKDLYRVSIAMLKNDDDALDGMQDAILKAFKGIKNLRKPEYFKTWLIKILNNSCKAIINKKRKIISYEEYINNPYEEECCGEIDIKDAVNKLDYQLKILIILYYYEDMSLKNISNVLDIPEGTVKSRLSRARGYLKEYLSDNIRSVF